MAMNSAMFGQQMSGALGAARNKKGKKARKAGFDPRKIGAPTGVKIPARKGGGRGAL